MVIVLLELFFNKARILEKGYSSRSKLAVTSPEARAYPCSLFKPRPLCSTSGKALRLTNPNEGVLQVSSTCEHNILVSKNVTMLVGFVALIQSTSRDA